jgi:hypothetical protein
MVPSIGRVGTKRDRDETRKDLSMKSVYTLVNALLCCNTVQVLFHHILKNLGLFEPPEYSDLKHTTFSVQKRHITGREGDEFWYGISFV